MSIACVWPAPLASRKDESVWRGRPLHCGMVSGIFGLSPLKVSSVPPAGTPRNSSGWCHVSPIKCKVTQGQSRSPLGTGRESRARRSGAQTPELNGLGSNPDSHPWHPWQLVPVGKLTSLCLDVLICKMGRRYQLQRLTFAHRTA